MLILNGFVAVITYCANLVLAQNFVANNIVKATSFTEF